jgi:hypothetical protein
MGGLWGVAGRTELNYVGTVLPKNSSGVDDIYGLDQRLVSDAIYPRALMLNSFLVHDAFRSRERGRLRPPPRENGGFMGERVFCDGSYEEAERLAVISHEKSWLKRMALYLSDFRAGRVGTGKSRRLHADKPTEFS